MVTVEFDRVDSSRVVWVTSETGDASRCFLDNDADGELDRFIINNEAGNSASEIRKKSRSNGSNAFVPMEELAKYAGTMADMAKEVGHSEKIKIYEFETTKDGLIIISSVNLETGEAYVVEGDDSAFLRNKVLNLYHKQVVEYGKQVAEYSKEVEK